MAYTYTNIKIGMLEGWEYWLSFPPHHHNSFNIVLLFLQLNGFLPPKTGKGACVIKSWTQEEPRADEATELPVGEEGAPPQQRCLRRPVAAPSGQVALVEVLQTW